MSLYQHHINHPKLKCLLCYETNAQGRCCQVHTEVVLMSGSRVHFLSPLDIEVETFERNVLSVCIRKRRGLAALSRTLGNIHSKSFHIFCSLSRIWFMLFERMRFYVSRAFSFKIYKAFFCSSRFFWSCKSST